ncbi:hypothetical protein RRG08_017272 [Elysia crispata]|uniref:Uncharacterized protein n=1 Tax=Elysia crispata TaxID=231223 RepID=A0AAE0XQP9_9GAST|nr:hypothetical protein RRG08_017272 [Elysia crispata]
MVSVANRAIETTRSCIVVQAIIVSAEKMKVLALIVLVLAPLIVTAQIPGCILHGVNGKNCQGKNQFEVRRGHFRKTYCCERSDLLPLVRYLGFGERKVTVCQCRIRWTVCRLEPERCRRF